MVAKTMDSLHTSTLALFAVHSHKTAAISTLVLNRKRRGRCSHINV